MLAHAQHLSSRILIEMWYREDERRQNSYSIVFAFLFTSCWDSAMDQAFISGGHSLSLFGSLISCLTAGSPDFSPPCIGW